MKSTQLGRGTPVWEALREGLPLLLCFGKAPEAFQCLEDAQGMLRLGGHEARRLSKMCNRLVEASEAALRKRNPERRDSPERRHAMGSVNRRRRARLATETRHARVEDPGQHECHRQTKRCRYDHGAHRPLGEPEFRHNGVRDLNRTPGRGRVPRCGAEHLSPPELADQLHRRGR